METENIENQNSNISLKEFWKLPLIQEISSALLLAMLSGSAISYFLSKLFIRDYLSGIGLKSLIYQALIDTSTVSSFAFGIAIIVFSFLLTFIIPSVVLRHLYHEKINLFEEYHRDNKRKIGLCLSFFLFIPFLFFIILIISECSIYFYFLSCFIPLLFFWFYVREKIESSKIWELTGAAILFSISITLSFFPFVHIFRAIYNVISDGMWIIILVGTIWLIYSFLYGIRITDNKPIQYFIDIILSSLIFYFIMAYSSHTIKNPISEFIGLKDKQPYIYSISQKDFVEIKNNIDTHWYYHQYSTDDKENIFLYAKRKSDNQIYLNTQIIFRNDKIAVLCPPDYEIIKQKPEVCFIANQEHLTPTTLTPTYINNPSLFIDKKWVVKYNYKTLNTENQK